MNIIVNGASRGIGREVALYLSNDKNNQILATGRSDAALKKLESEGINDNITYLKMDLLNLEKDIDIVMEQVFSRFSRVDILINVAGELVVKDFMHTNEREAHLMMETNFFGPALLIRNIVPIMPSGSHIVNISSMGGFQGSSKYKGLSYYSASKAALSALSECLAVELSEEGIIVNCLALGAVRTEMFENAFPEFSAPLGPEEMASFISWFSLSGNRFFNGKVLPVALNNP